MLIGHLFETDSMVNGFESLRPLQGRHAGLHVSRFRARRDALPNFTSSHQKLKIETDYQSRGQVEQISKRKKFQNSINSIVHYLLPANQYCNDG